MSRLNQSKASALLHGLALLLAVMGAWGIGSCKDPSRAVGTSVFVYVDIPDGGAVTQVRFSAKADAGMLFEPVIRPRDESATPLPTGQTIRILLPDSLGGQSIAVGAEGLLQGRVMAEAHQLDVKVRKGFEVEVDLTLGGVDPNCGACAGCCSGVACVTSYTPLNCGNDLICSTCNPVSADTCATGECRCGDNPPCLPDAGSDRCLQRKCWCGTNDPCQPGQVCIDGQCTCTATSCSNGCCSGPNCILRGDAGNCGNAGFTCDRCNVGQSCTGGVCSDCPANCPSGCCSGEACHLPDFSSCGRNGSACIACDPIAADRCINGICSCGTGAACGPGLHCTGVACTCDALSCPNGCCRNGVCEVSQFRTCGKSGRSCTACDPLRSDSCTSSGVCACGGAPACETGTRCVNGACVCDPATCSGCCSADGLSCRPGNSQGECGKLGLTCQVCPSDQNCAGGVCSGCTATSCSGCCVGSTCVVASPGPCSAGGGSCYCGLDGTSCRSCATLTTDSCLADGGCGCGRGSPCSAGQQCIGGACSCNRTSCPSGCCSPAGACQQLSTDNCGSPGSSCFTCPTQFANNCSSAGDCRCNSAPACASGQQCLSNGCVCNRTSCANGCCSNGQCITPSAASCGILGSSCAPCDSVRANRCVNGVCGCGDGGVCNSGQVCDGGTCQCTPTSCSSGCCSGDMCITTLSRDECGLGGQACARCPTGGVCNSGVCQCCSTSCSTCSPTVADTCTGLGSCQCGGGLLSGPCTPPQRCVGGRCI